MKPNQKLIFNSRKFSDKSVPEKTSILQEIVNEYVEGSSIHGLKYLGKLPIKVGLLGKFIWICTMISGFVCLSLMAWRFWRRYEDNPTSTLIEFYSPIFLAPFPAVTVCPATPTTVKRQQNLLEKLHLPSDMDHQDVMFLLKYGSDISEGLAEHLPKLKEFLQANDLRLVDFLRLIRPCEDAVESCWWNGVQINCTHHVRMTHTFRGLCCSYNYILENYFEPGSVEEYEPIYTDRYGPQTGLMLVFKQDLFADDNDTGVALSLNNQNIFVYIHHSIGYLGYETSSHILQSGEELQLSVQPKLSRKLGGFYRRNMFNEMDVDCISGDRGMIKYFPKYGYSNCYASCRIDAAIRHCGCVPYHYEPVARNYSIRLCDVDDLTCLNVHAEDIKIVKEIRKQNYSCICRNPCRNMQYQSIPATCTIKESDFHPSPIYKNMSDNQAVLRVYMNSELFTISEMIPAADGLYFLASIGGIFSLFLGCSFLSLVEIIYFVILLYRNWYSGSKQ